MGHGPGLRSDSEDDDPAILDTERVRMLAASLGKELDAAQIRTAMAIMGQTSNQRVTMDAFHTWWDTIEDGPMSSSVSWQVYPIFIDAGQLDDVIWCCIRTLRGQKSRCYLGEFEL
jgi:hypothetical protein